MFSRLFKYNTSNLFTKSRKSSNIFSNIGIFKRFISSKPAQPPKPPTGLKLLIKKYGNLALGVYLSLSLIDLPICFLLVHSAGEDVIREYQDKFTKFIGLKKDKPVSDNEIVYDSEGNVIPNPEIEEEKSSTLGTEFALAYAIHKSLIFIRLPITAAITPPLFTRLTTVGILGFKMKKKAKLVSKITPK